MMGSTVILIPNIDIHIPATLVMTIVLINNHGFYFHQLVSSAFSSTSQ